MDLILKPSGGQNIVLRPQARAAWYEEPTVDAQEVELFRQEIDPATGATIGPRVSLGRFPAEGRVVIPHNPDIDRDVRFYVQPFAADNTPGYSDIRHAEQATVLFRRETEAPVIAQSSDATTDAVEIGITGHTRFARHRRVTICEDAGMTIPVRTIVLDSDDYAARELPRYLTLTREASGEITAEDGETLTTEDGEALVIEEAGGALGLTVYVTVAHSSGVAWTPESNVLEITFADGGGAGGSTGDFDPTPRDYRTIDEV
jgi:hypothetical protein